MGSLELARLLAAFEQRQARQARAARLERASVVVSDDGTRSVGVRQTLAGVRNVALEGARALLPHLTTAEASLWFTQVAPDPVAGHLWLAPSSVLVGVSAGGWEPLTDQSGAGPISGLREALVTDDGRIDVWRQAAPPPTAAFGDLWFDSGDTPWRWENGVWASLVPDVSQSATYVPGEEGWGFQSDGDAQVKDLSVLGQLAGGAAAFSTVSLDGTDLAVQLSASSIGKILSARLGQFTNPVITSTSTKLLELNCGIVQAGRTYRVQTDLLVFGTGTLANTDRCRFLYRYTTDGTSPTTSSPTMAGGLNEENVYTGNLGLTYHPSAEVDIAAEAPLKVGLFVQLLSPSAGSYSVYTGASTEARPVMSLYDDGPSGARNDGAISLTGGGVARFTKTFLASWAWGVTEADVLINDSYFYVGNATDGTVGHYGLVGFDSAAMVAGLAGSATPISCTLRWKPRTRKTAAGLDVRILTHNYASRAAAQTGESWPEDYTASGALTSRGTFSNAVPNTSYDFSLTTLFSSFKAGTVKGVGFVNSATSPWDSHPDGSGSVYGNGTSECQLIFVYDGTS